MSNDLFLYTFTTVHGSSAGHPRDRVNASVLAVNGLTSTMTTGYAVKWTPYTEEGIRLPAQTSVSFSTESTPSSGFPGHDGRRSYIHSAPAKKTTL